MAEYQLNVNGEVHHINVEPDMPLLWVLRDVLGLTGTKYSCGKGVCGACTIHLDGNAVPSCVLKVSEVTGFEITTIEGLAPEKIDPLRQAWEDNQVPQCGYCQPGQIMAASSLLDQNPDPDDDDIDEAMSGNLCRCGTYQRVRKAIHDAAGNGGGS